MRLETVVHAWLALGFVGAAGLGAALGTGVWYALG